MSTPLFELHTIALLTLETLCDDKCSASARRPTTHNLSERLFPLPVNVSATLYVYPPIRTTRTLACSLSAQCGPKLQLLGPASPPIGHINAFV